LFLKASATLHENHDPAAARAQRWRSSVIVLLAMVLVSGLLLFRIQGGPLTLGDITIAGTIMYGITISTFFSWRKSLMTNVFHRGLVSLGLLLVTQILCLRLLCVLLHLDILKCLPIEEMAAVGGLASIAKQYLPLMWSAVFVALAVSIASGLWPQYAVALGVVYYPVTIAIFTYSWLHAGSTRTANKVT
jgi:hypothetical protein